MSEDIRVKRVMVTGAGGFIGLHLLRSLHRLGYIPVAVIVGGRSVEPISTLPFPIEIQTVEDPAEIGQCVLAVKPDYVVHLNAFISTSRSLEAMEQSVRWNLLSTISLLTACAQLKTRRVILMGSCEEYSEQSSPFDARAVPDPLSPYGASKAATTAYGRMFFNAFGLDTVVLRPAVVYGPGQRSRMLIPAVMRALAEGVSIDVTEGRQTRDFVYVTDVVDAIVRALEASDVGGRSFNVGSGEVTTVRECLQAIEALAGRAGLVRYGARPYEERETFRYELKLGDTFDALGWRPQVMLQDGLRMTWDAIASTRNQAS